MELKALYRHSVMYKEIWRASLLRSDVLESKDDT